MGIPIAPHIVAHPGMEMEATAIIVLPIMEVMAEENLHHELPQVHLVPQMEGMTVTMKAMDYPPTLITEMTTIGEFLIVVITVGEYCHIEDTRFQQRYTLGSTLLESWKR